MISLTIKPSKTLEAFIDYYWVFESPDISGIGEQFVYPQGSSELMFHYETPFSTINSEGQAKMQTECFLCTQKLTSMRVSPIGKIGLISVYFKPYGASVMFDVIANELNEINIDLGNVVGDKYKALIDEIASAANFQIRIGIIEKYLLKRMALRSIYEIGPLGKAIDLINLRCGMLSVDDVASAACMSGRHLDRLFVKRIGLSPKQFIRVRKMNFAISLMKAKKKISLTELALEAGYYDQSHFTNDFKEITGITPKQFIKIMV
jgi:AraC-like DNA-binding protein